MDDAALFHLSQQDRGDSDVEFVNESRCDEVANDRGANRV
jgi:hypothetical protein